MLKHLQSREDWNDKTLGAKGFTLIELLVVIVILGILGAVVVFSVRGVTNNSKDSACKTEKRTLATAVEAYYADNSAYPANVAKLYSVGLLNDTTSLAGTGYSIDQTTGKVTGTCPQP